MQRQRLRTALVVVACFSLQGGNREFWEAKDSASWTSEEKQSLLVQSPWAKEGFARLEVDKKGSKPQGGRNVAIPDPNGGNTPGRARSVQIGGEVPPVPSNDPGPKVQFRVLARWEAAKPVRLAGGPEIPEVAGQFYVIRLRGLPLMPPPKVKPGQTAPNPNEGMLEAIKQGSFLERKDKPAIRCAHLFTGSGDQVNEVLLFFPRGGDDAITLADKLVTLESRFAAFHVSIKFPLKEMVFQGELSL